MSKKKQSLNPTLLVCKCNRGKDVRIYSPNTYGMETWGSTSQDFLDKKRKYWYIYSWTDGGEWFDDITYECKLDVLLETKRLFEVIKYVEQNYPHCLQSVKDECEDIITKHNAFMHWTERNLKL